MTDHSRITSHHATGARPALCFVKANEMRGDKGLDIGLLEGYKRSAADCKALRGSTWFPLQAEKVFPAKIL